MTNYIVLSVIRSEISAWLLLLWLWIWLNISVTSVVECGRRRISRVNQLQQQLPPLPVLPIPSNAQLQWQRREMIMFLHFGMNTFTDSEWGSGKEEPWQFNPGSTLDTEQWVRVAKAGGASLVILTAKHHDGFCLWPSAYTNYSVRNSPWKQGRGDVIGELAEAARRHGVEVGLYVSPWDRHDPRYGDTLLYNEYYMAQLREVLTRYGAITEVWMDGAKGKEAPKMRYAFKRWFALAHALQPTLSIFSDAGPDVRWVGDEQGRCGLTCWSLFNTSHARIGLGANTQILNNGDPHGVNWVPPECDVSIRPGWFWHKDEHPKTPLQLLDIYYKSVGRNCVLLLNVPPNSSGLISHNDINALLTFKKIRDQIFGSKIASNSIALVHASSCRGAPFNPFNIVNDNQDTFWAPSPGQAHSTIMITLKGPIMFNVVELQEPIQFGQRVAQYRVLVMVKNKWMLFSSGTTIGYKKLDRGCIIKATHVKVVIEKSHDDPLLSYFSFYLDLISKPLPGCFTSE